MSFHKPMAETPAQRKQEQRFTRILLSVYLSLPLLVYGLLRFVVWSAGIEMVFSLKWSFVFIGLGYVWIFVIALACSRMNEIEREVN